MAEDQQPQGKYGQQAAKKSDKGSQAATAIKVLIAGVAIVALGVFLMWSLEEMQSRNEYNRIVDMLNEQQYEEAIPELEALKANADDEMKARINSDLAMCHVQLSRDMNISLEEQRDLLNQAYTLDPDALEPDELRIIGK